MKPREAAVNQPESASRRGIPGRLTLAVVPVAAVAVLAGVLLVWNVLATDTTPGYSWTELGVLAIAAVVVVVAIGTLISMYMTGRSMSRRIEDVSSAARRVAHKDLVDLLEALRNPDTNIDSIAQLQLDTSQEDEVGDLARSFEELHGSLIEVGARQMEALRAGVSSIFVTLARRNSSLVDRQLALLDSLEAKEDDPEVLSGFYQLDHLATRMRRNSESLLVLAGSESPRVWAKPTDMADVVRAAISEIDEYQRIEVLALEPARLSGGAVSDVVHLVAELLENAIQFSPPSEMVRVTGLFDMGGYQLAVSDRGVGMSVSRLAEMNRILDRPPALGLSVDPTLGMHVVAKLAHRHGLDVELIKGVPGLTVRVTIPRDHLEVEEEKETPWQQEVVSSRPERKPSTPSPTEFADTETRQYVANRSRDQSVSETAEIEQVIDLTQPDYSEPDPDKPETGLPVRRPGRSFGDEDVGSDAVSPGEGASHIKSALSAYDRGRRSAFEADEALGGRPWKDQEEGEEGK